MAIEKFYFSDTGANHFADIKAWMEKNATDYFDSFSLQSDPPALFCKNGDKTVLECSRNLSGQEYYEKVYLFDGTSHTSNTAGTYNTYIRKIVKTDHGIAIQKSRAGSLENNYTFITKTNYGDTAITSPENMRIGWSSASSYVMYIAAFTSDIAGFKSLGSTTNNFLSTSADLTVLCPIFFLNSNGAYTPDLLKSPYSNMLGTECTLIQDGEKYFYNGFVALRE